MLTVSIGGITQSPLPAMHWEHQRQAEHMSVLHVPVTHRNLKGKGPRTLSFHPEQVLGPSTPPPPHPRQRAEEHHKVRENSGSEMTDAPGL